MPVVVLDLNRRIVHEDADGEGHAAERHDVQRLTQQMQHADRCQKGQRNRRDDNERAPPRMQEQQNHQRRQKRGDLDRRRLPAQNCLHRRLRVGSVQIAPRGDLASRSLLVRLAVDRPDPENREFKRSDPIAWTDANRGRILQALYTILLGNPRRGQQKANLKPVPTRFKEWWDMVGSAVEYAAAQHAEQTKWLVADSDVACPPRPIEFKKMFLEGEADDEQANSLATVVDVLRRVWPNGCQARNVASYAGRDDDEAKDFKAALEMASGKSLKIISATTVAWRLKGLTDAPVKVGSAVLVLKYEPDHHGGQFAVRTVA